MAHPQGLVSFPGVQAIIATDIVRGHGISPSTITLTITPQQTLPERQGDLILRYGSFYRKIPDCIVDQVQFKFDSNGYIWQMVILDRRWKWQYLHKEGKHVSGRWNIRQPHGPVEVMDPKTKKKARDIMIECLTQMGELRKVRFAQAVPELYPEIDWDRENPARALASICDLCGMRVVYRFDDTILITKTGIDIRGRKPALPNGPVIYDNLGFNPPETPSEIHLVCGATRYQADFYCEAVGDDVDGITIPIEDLSYKPPAPGGWEYGDEIEWLDVPLFQGQPTLWKDMQRPRELARGSVYRKYRITLKAFSIPGYKDKAKIKVIDEVLPIGQQLVEAAFDKTNGWIKPIETMVWGVFAWGAENNVSTILDNQGAEVPPWKFKPDIVIPEIDAVTGDPIKSKNTTLIPPQEYSLDPETGIITFSNLVYRYYTDPDVTPAKLAKKPAAIWLRCGICINDKDTRQPKRHVEKLKIKGAPRGAGILEIRDDTLFVRIEPKYSKAQPASIIGIKDNYDIVKKEAKKRLEAEAAKFQQLGPAMRTYAGWHNFDLDGAVHQVAYHLSFDGKATMTACLNDELTILTMPYQERRFYEKMKTYTEELSNVMRFTGQYRYPFSPVSNLTRRGT